MPDFLSSFVSATILVVTPPIVDFIYNVFDEYTTVAYFKDIGQNQKFIEVNYTIPEIPEKFFNENYIINSTITHFSWKNQNEQAILFEQKPLTFDSLLDSEDIEVTEKTVNNTPCLLMEQYYSYIYYWEFDGYGFMLTYPIDLGEEFAESVIGKLVPLESTAK